jgi:hypothetical protein
LQLAPAKKPVVGQLTHYQEANQTFQPHPVYTVIGDPSIRKADAGGFDSAGTNASP